MYSLEIGSITLLDRDSTGLSMDKDKEHLKHIWPKYTGSGNKNDILAFFLLLSILVNLVPTTIYT